MARKNVWEVLKTTSADVAADTLLLIRGATDDVRRILPQDIFGAHPVLRDVTAQQTTGPLTSEGTGDTGVDVVIDDEDNGSGRGARISIAANLNGATPAPGALRVQNGDGDWYNLYVDGNGKLRISDDAQIISTNIDDGELVGAGTGTYEFDLHDEVDVELTALADVDRFPRLRRERRRGSLTVTSRPKPCQRTMSALLESFPSDALFDRGRRPDHNAQPWPRAQVDERMGGFADQLATQTFATGTRVLVSGPGYYNARNILIQLDTLTTTQATVRLDVSGTDDRDHCRPGRARFGQCPHYSDVRFRYQFFG